ncbi:MAG: hypothetical protein ACLR4Z_16695 [Butyricicoccaceae bacterium]
MVLSPRSSDFKLLYANDLGLPDFVAASDGLTIGSGDPTQAAETLLGLSPAASQLSGTDQDAAPYNDITQGDVHASATTARSS